MVRTRGLGRAIGRVIGRDRQDEDDAVDVPQRRKPTASARRQQVQQMTEDVSHMTEDVPHMAEDAPEMTTDIQAIVAEDLGRDGAEGSHADDAEGFRGGPRDPSVLTSFVDHVANAIWSGQERPKLKLVSHGRKVMLIGRETSTFHLSVGELTITLDDVLSLLHLPISGAFHSFHALSVDEALDEASRTTTRQIEGYLTLLQCWIYEHFPSVHQCVTDDAYEETSPRASRWLTTKAHMKGITGASYQACCDALTVTDVCWLPYSEHRGVRGFELISSFQGQLRWDPMVVTVRPKRVLRQFGYIQSIPSPPVSALLSYDDIDDMWMHFADHVLAVGELCVVPG
ncbi:hypothetical protein GmHk_09G025747 [Glycine max]|nr:hypothetical protein GmHk_09G025747 [Glycine max]KAH1233266.1 hypothetical protein GmHk_09G025747 [Glycine max]